MPSKERKEAEATRAFTEKIRAAIVRAGHTQRSLAKVLKMDEAYLSKVVRGQIEPAVGRAIQISRVLKTEAAKIWG